MFFKPATWESKTYKEKGIENKKKQSRELNKMPKIKMNFLEMQRYYFHEKRTRCYEKKQVLENQNKSQKIN